MKKIVFCFTFICLLAMSFQAQTKTIKGNYCGQNTGNAGGTFGFRVGPKVVTLQMNFGQDEGNAKMVRFNFRRLKVGDEFIVKYNSEGFITAITGTGKRKSIKPCTVD